MCTMTATCDENITGYRWHGPAHTGAMRGRREVKRVEAEARNALTKPENRRQARLAREAEAKRKRDEKASRKRKNTGIENLRLIKPMVAHSKG